jgi:hypothetical protein
MTRSIYWVRRNTNKFEAYLETITKTSFMVKVIDGLEAIK